MWAQITSTLIGIWLMAAPGVLNYRGAAAKNDYIVGALVASFSIIAIWEVTRALRWLNLLQAVWLMVAPLIFLYSFPANLNSILCAFLLVPLSLIKGRISYRVGGGWLSLWRSTSSRDHHSG